MTPAEWCRYGVVTAVAAGWLMTAASWARAASGDVQAWRDTVAVRETGTPASPDTPTGERAEDEAPAGPLRLSVMAAVLRALENNRALAVERLTPDIRQTAEGQAQAVFDPALRADITAGREKAERLARSGAATETYTTDDAEATIALEQYFPTGTTVRLEADATLTDSSLYAERFYETRLAMSLDQPLLRGRDGAVNLARLRQARLATRMSLYELCGFTAALVAEVEQTYWNYALARRQIEIVDASLAVVGQQLEETRELIAVGRLASAELAAVQAEVAAQRQALIEARANAAAMHLKLLRLIGPPTPGRWDAAVELVHPPSLPEIRLASVDRHVAVAMQARPLLNEARLRIQHGDLEVVKTRNGLLPRMDLFLTLGKSGYASSFGDTFGRMDRDRYDAQIGFRLDFPLLNREAQAQHRAARLTRDQAQAALENLSQLVDVDVRSAYIEVDRTRQQIAASSATRTFDEEKLRIETEKLRVGKSTSFLVAQAQRDLLASRIAEVRALVNTINALVDLYRLDGSLLARRGVSAPGADPVDDADRN